MTPQKLFADISSGHFKPVYYFFGSEDFRIVEAEKYIAHQFLPRPQVSVNYRRIDGKRTSCADVIAELSVYPMLGERQVVAVTDFQSYKPTEIDRILKLLSPPDPNRVVIFSSPSTKAPKSKSAFLRKIAATAESVEFKRLMPEEMRRTIVARLGKAQMTIEPDALDLMVELLDGNRGAAEAELGKLIDYKEAGQAVTSDDVGQIAAGFQVHNVFRLADDVIAGDRVKVLHEIERLMAGGNSPTGILYFLGQHFITLYLFKNGRPLEANRRWLRGKFREQADRYKSEQLESIILEIARADSQMRRSSVKPELLLEQLIVKLMPN